MLGAARVFADDAPNPAGAEFFENKIRPLLSAHCFECHSAKSEELKGKLLLDTREGLLKGGETGRVVVPGDPDKSLMIQAVRYKNEKLQMPPDDKLSDAQIADLEAWVKMGAPDPRGAGAVAAHATTNPSEWNNRLDEGRKQWAFQKPIDHPPPNVKN